MTAPDPTPAEGCRAICSVYGAHVFDCPNRPSAVPDTGDVEAAPLDAESQVWALADELCTTWHGNDGEHEGETLGLSGWLASRWACQDCYDTACTLVDTKWLAADRAQVARTTAERIAEGVKWLPSTTRPGEAGDSVALAAVLDVIARGDGAR